MAAPNSMTSKLRDLHSRHLSTGHYLKALTELADLEPGSDEGAVDRVTAMRLRIEVLERRVRELEAHK